MTQHNFPIDSASVSDRGLSQKRPQNEDSYLELNETGLFVVADGVGGAKAGDVASQMAVEVLSEAFANFDSNQDAEELMKLAIEKANSAIYQMSQDLTKLSTMATTIVALHISGNIATIGHVGDSRLYRMDGAGRLYPETLDHSVVAEEVRAGRMTVAQAANHPSRNIISRALGADSVVDVDLKTIMFEPKTTFLLCSDGITRHIEDLEIRDLLISVDKADAVCQRMKDICYSRGAEDNLTAVIAKVNPHSAAAINASSDVGFTTEPEEITVANTKPPLVDTGILTASTANDDQDDEFQTQKLEMPGEIAEELSTSDEFDDAHHYIDPVISDEGIEPEFVEDELDQSLIESEIEKDIEEIEHPVYTKVADDVEISSIKPTTSTLGNIVSSLVIFLIGAVLGAALLYTFSLIGSQPSQVTVPVATNSASIDDDDFEERRRSVDDAGEIYIQDNEASAETAEDFYLLGRAYFFGTNFPEAKKAFEEVENRQFENEKGNGTVVENDIKAFMIVIENVPFGQRSLKEKLSEENSANDSIENENDSPETQSDIETNSEL